jgi:uncharacterized protein (DUF736 family)
MSALLQGSNFLSVKLNDSWRARYYAKLFKKEAR